MSHLAETSTVHPTDEKQEVHDAAEWLAAMNLGQRPRPIIPAMRSRFGLSAPEACRAIREASLIQARSH